MYSIVTEEYLKANSVSWYLKRGYQLSMHAV